MTREEMIETLREKSKQDPKLEHLASLLACGTRSIEEVLFNTTVIFSGIIARLDEKFKERSDPRRVVEALFPFRQDPMIGALIRAIEAGAPVLPSLLHGIMLLTQDRRELLQELFELKSQEPVVFKIVKERESDEGTIKDFRGLESAIFDSEPFKRKV